jgi:hypothetical protein
MQTFQVRWVVKQRTAQQVYNHIFLELFCTSTFSNHFLIPSCSFRENTYPSPTDYVLDKVCTQDMTIKFSNNMMTGNLVNCFSKE